MEPLSEIPRRYFERAYQSLLSHHYLYILSQSVKPKHKRSHTFDFDLDNLGMSANVFFNALLMFGYSIELLMKALLIYNNYPEKKFNKLQHDIPLILKEVAISYNSVSLFKYTKLAEGYREIIVWLGKYPLALQHQQKSIVNDLLLLQDDRKNIWTDLINVFESTLSTITENNDYNTSKFLLFGFNKNTSVGGEYFYNQVLHIALTRIKSVGSSL